MCQPLQQHPKKRDKDPRSPATPRGSLLSLGTLSPSSTGSRKEPERIMPLGLSARERVLPIWEVLYSSKVESWVGMLLERVIRGVVAAVGLTARRRRGRGRVRAGIGVGKRGWERSVEGRMGKGSRDRGPKAEAREES